MAITKNNNLRRGSKDANGSTDVLDLQKALNGTGWYNLAEDGSYGAKTETAVKDYQKRMGLKVDGVVGTNTWGSLTAGKQNAVQKPVQNPVQKPAQNTEQPSQATQPAKNYQYDHADDPVYQAAVQARKDIEANAPVLEKTYDQSVQELFDQVMNQKPFEYDLNGDALWQQYKDQAVTMGNMAMMDTMGQAAALTGGYGSSYAQNVGQQAYQGHLQKLGERVPELYQLALDKYNTEYAMKRDQLGTAKELQDAQYGRYQDQLDQHNIDVDRAIAQEDTAYDRGSGAWYTQQQMLREDENTDYEKQRDSFDKLANLIASSGYTPSQAELQAAGMSATEANAYAKVYKDEQKAARSAVDSSDGTKDTKISIPSEIKSQIGKLKTVEEKAEYIFDLENSGVVDTTTAEYLKKVYDADFNGNDNTEAFEKGLHSEREHDAVMRALYGSYKQYVSQMIEESNLTDFEKMYLIGEYEISDMDAQKKKH